MLVWCIELIRKVKGGGRKFPKKNASKLGNLLAPKWRPRRRWNARGRRVRKN